MAYVDSIIIYDDGSVYVIPNDGPPEQAPRDGVQVIAVPDDQSAPDTVGYRIVDGTGIVGQCYFDWIGEPFQWWAAHDDHDHTRFNAQIAPERLLWLRGYEVSNRRFRELRQSLTRFEGSLLPRKSARNPRERKI